MNLITDPILTLSSGDRVSLPTLFAAMARGQVRSFPALRPHQRPAWHMFLAQLGALALWSAGRNDLPENAADWVGNLRRLTQNHRDDAPWRLIVEEPGKPAFLQPPDPGGLKWSTIATPDALDLLITSRNHDLKQAAASHAAAEDWVFALVSLQTSEGYGGNGNHGIARMNGGSSSRPMLGLAPGRDGEISVDPSAWWARDRTACWDGYRGGQVAPVVSRLAGRQATRLAHPGSVVHRSMPPGAPDRPQAGALSAIRATSDRQRRIDAKVLQGRHW